MKNLIVLFFIITFLASCTGIKNAGKVLRNEKVTTTDEFLVKKRNALVLPPNYEEIPEPGSVIQKKEKDDARIKKILKAPKTDNSLKNSSKSIEESILKRIR